MLIGHVHSFFLSSMKTLLIVLKWVLSLLFLTICRDPLSYEFSFFVGYIYCEHLLGSDFLFCSFKVNM